MQRAVGSLARRLGARVVRSSRRAPFAAQATSAPIVSETQQKRGAPITLSVGQKVHGFTVESIEPVEEFSVTAVQLAHDQTGAKYLHLATTEDSNNTFAVLFRTTPEDSTGVAHILEHTALCGSDKYPVRDPFFNMLKRSLCTFMNAMTGPDFTMYPFSTQNESDFSNLLSVYLDACFFPAISPEDFRQEGHRLEFEKPEDPDSGLKLKGVVFNEMKGAMSSQASQFSRAMASALFPTTTYHHNSGGDPATIPELSHEQLKEFHATHYHPSNAIIYSYGDLPLESTLEKVDAWALSKFDPIDASHLLVGPEQRLAEPQRIEVTGPPEAMVPDPERVTTVSTGYLLAAVHDDPLETLALRIASDLLVSGPNAPFYQSLIESQLGAAFAPGTGYSGQRREGSFAIGVKGARSDDVASIEAAIEATFEKVADEGFRADLLEATMHQIELSQRSVSPSFGLSTGFGALLSWMHNGDPLTSLRVGDRVQQLRDAMEADDQYWQKLVRRNFLDNQHRVTVVMNPEEEYNSKLEEAEAAKVKAIEDALTDEERGELVEKALELAASQDKAQNVEVLPTLQLSDIREEVEKVEFFHRSLGGVEVQFNPQATNGLTYVSAMFDTNDIPERLQPYLPLFTALLTSLGTSELEYRELSNQIKGKTGGVSAALGYTGGLDNLDTLSRYLLLESDCLDRNLEPMLELLNQLTTPGGVAWAAAPARLRELMKGMEARMAGGVAGNGLGYASSRAGAGLTPAGTIRDSLGGIPHVAFVSKLMAEEAAKPDSVLGPDGSLPAALSEIADIVFARVAKARVCAMEGVIPEAEAPIAQWLETLKQRSTGGGEAATAAEFAPALGTKTAFAVPSQTNYCAATLRTVPYTHPDAAALVLLAQGVSTLYLHREIREKGGAYGGNAGASSLGGTFSMSSYRDPRTVETLQVFKDAAQWAASKDAISERDLTEAKLRAFKGIDSPTAPASRGMTRFTNPALTDEQRQVMRTRLLEVSVADLKAAAEKHLLPAFEDGTANLAMVASPEALARDGVEHGSEDWKVLGSNDEPFKTAA